MDLYTRTLNLVCVAPIEFIVCGRNSTQSRSKRTERESSARQSWKGRASYYAALSLSIVHDR